MVTGDEADLVTLFGDRRVTAFMGRPLDDRAAAAAFIEEVRALAAKDTLYQWGSALTESDRLVGTVTLWSIDRRNARAELGFAVAHAHWGKGYGSEAVGIALDYAFSELELHRLEADVDPDNLASLKLLERLGFEREGYLPERWYMGGEWRDSVLLGLLAAKRTAP